MRRLSTWAVAWAIGLLVSGCYTDFGPVVPGDVGEAMAPSPLNPARGSDVTGSIPGARQNRIQAGEYRIQAGDKVRVIVYGEDTLNGLYEVSPSGMLSLPLIGTINAAGRSRAGLEEQIANRYSAFIKDAKVTLSVIEYRPFYVMGEVLRPGKYPFESGLTAMSAITTAGGLTYRADRSVVLVQRSGEDVWHSYPLTGDVSVGPGDVVRVPERYF
jgi:protein involved in polysaccharide export with SLBB domain